MKQNIENAVEWLKQQNVKGCITGSVFLGYFEGQDIDLFVYDEKSFTKILNAMFYNPLFQITDPLEQWKYDKYIDIPYDNFYKTGLITIKFKYNTCIDVNVIIKKTCTNIFSVLSTFDMNIITKGYDIQTKQILDLSEGSQDTKIADWNKWNTTFYDIEVWKVNKLLRQIERVFKYHKRGYNTDNVVLKYIELINGILKYQSVFINETYNQRLEITKNNLKIVKKLCEVWLKHHIITDEQLEVLKTKIREL